MISKAKSNFRKCLVVSVCILVSAITGSLQGAAASSQSSHNYQLAPSPSGYLHPSEEVDYPSATLHSYALTLSLGGRRNPALRALIARFVIKAEDSYVGEVFLHTGTRYRLVPERSSILAQLYLFTDEGRVLLSDADIKRAHVALDLTTCSYLAYTKFHIDTALLEPHFLAIANMNYQIRRSFLASISRHNFTARQVYSALRLLTSTHDLIAGGTSAAQHLLAAGVLEQGQLVATAGSVLASDARYSRQEAIAVIATFQPSMIDGEALCRSSWGGLLLLENLGQDVAQAIGTSPLLQLGNSGLATMSIAPGSASSASATFTTPGFTRAAFKH